MSDAFSGAAAIFSDAHCHIFDLLKACSATSNACTDELPALVATSAWGRDEFEFHEDFARRAEGTARVVQCFGVHPQLPSVEPTAVQESLETLYALAAEKRLDAVGETGFDLFHDKRVDFRPTEAEQEKLFAAHLELAAAHGLPLVLHVRRAMHKVFAYTERSSGALTQVPAVIFHSYSGTADDGASLLKRGVNAYFSFGAPILLNHKTAQAACASLPARRLLCETDAPYQPLRGELFSHWGNLTAITEAMRLLRQPSSDEATAREKSIAHDTFIAQLATNFGRAYGLNSS